jgi:hypothetical protein
MRGSCRASSGLKALLLEPLAQLYLLRLGHWKGERRRQPIHSDAFPWPPTVSKYEILGPRATT